jgi:hypothetical protein
MAITYYEPGEHRSGFVGARVVVPAGNKRNYQAYFTAKPDDGWTQEDWNKRQQLRAQIYNLSRECRALLRQYRWLIRCNDRRTPEIYAVGAQGIRMYAERRQRVLGGWVFGFQVSQFPNLVPLKIPIKSLTLSEAWKVAVDAWAEHHGVRPKDKADLLSRQPDPERFKQIRRYLNDEKRKHIPPEALRPVFAEKRQSLADQKTRETLKAETMDDELARLYQTLAKDIESRESPVKEKQ